MFSMAESPYDQAVRYRLLLSPEARDAIEATFADYARMMDMLDEIASAKGIGANLVALHGHAYDPIRKATRLPSRLVTLGLRDRAAYRAASNPRLPLDDRLVNVRDAGTLSLGTALGRVTIPFEVTGYVAGWTHATPAQLVRTDDGDLEIHFGVIAASRQHISPRKDNVMLAEHAPAPDTLLSRAGRLIAGIAYGAIDKAEDNNKVALVKQAIREIEQAERDQRDGLAAARAEEYRLNARRAEIERETAALAEQIQVAIGENRDDLARAGIARQMDLEAQFEVLSKAIDENAERVDAVLTSLRAILSSLQDAQARLAELERSEVLAKQPKAAARKTEDAGLAKATRASRAIARATGVPEGIPPSPDIDELSKLKRDKDIAERLARLKAQN
ncbi:PspA/IM30 family protein [Bradyrhizobium aeschynomenes]|uniref:PspA/IM30 family protein n=1 Tax=Bradyrhizobium aeschynomenes TaxID=2734909 RepID=UPI0015577207|nr:PspA/IM30 family protein [Bradyrhizobium aeschynomenes]NPV20536.1 PspA/IM30 family protein [Bradyrhizobium aeschynomenes]